jgi:hypothetical protein
VRFRGGISAAGGGEFGSGFGFGLAGLDGRLGVQINNLFGVYVQPHLSFGSGSVNGVSGATGTFAITGLAELTLIDRIFVGAGGGFGLANNPSGPVAHFRLGAYPLVGRSDGSIVRKGLMVGVDTRVLFVSQGGSGLTVVQIMGAIGYEAF